MFSPPFGEYVLFLGGFLSKSKLGCTIKPMKPSKDYDGQTPAASDCTKKWGEVLELKKSERPAEKILFLSFIGCDYVIN